MLAPPSVCPSITNTSSASKLIPAVFNTVVYAPSVGFPLSISNVAPDPADS